jgi:ribosomal protein S12 methylthiotransferase accessory factor
MGAHPDREVAVARALTEVAQGRVVDGGAGTAAAPPGLAAATCVTFTELPTHPSDDVVTDIDTMLRRLRAGGLTRVIAVDMSPPEVPVHVVRLLVPGLESWGIDRSRIGARATRAWNDAARAAAGGSS